MVVDYPTIRSGRFEAIQFPVPAREKKQPEQEQKALREKMAEQSSAVNEPMIVFREGAEP